MMYTRPFDGTTMRGATWDDNNALTRYINRDLDETLVVDQYNRVFDAQDTYIADVVDVDAGDGLLGYYPE